jgi:alkyldihydroxyacetonephosphate synthase
MAAIDDLPVRPAARAPMAWAGWGDPSHERHLGRGALRLLRAELGLDAAVRTPAVALAAVAVPPSRLPAAVRARLAAVVGEDGVATDREPRIRRAGGRSYPDLVRLRAGDAGHAPDAVVAPSSHDEVRAVLAVCADAGVAVVPFGGGTSVVGGVEPLRGRFDAVVSLDLGRMDRLLELDPIAGTATFEPGIRGAEAEALLAERGFTLGHFPQSHEQASIGGYVAAVSSVSTSSPRSMRASRRYGPS